MLMRLIRRLFSRSGRAGQTAAVDPVTQVSSLDTALDLGASVRTGSESAVAGPMPAIVLRELESEPQHAASGDAMLPVADQIRQRVVGATAALTADVPMGAAGDDLRALLQSLAGEPAGVIRQLPSAAQEALALCNGGEVSQSELTALVERDPMLTQALLHSANSAYYQRSGQAPVVSIRAAIERIGLSGLRSVLLKVTVSGLLCRPGGAFGSMVLQVWEHMVRTAPLARQLAHAYTAVPDTAFSLGLLHDVGKLVIFDQVATMRTALRRDLRADPEQVRQLLRHLHEPLGGTAALEWGLGDEAALAIASHHRAPPPLVKSAYSEILFLAERADLADVRDQPFDMEAIWRDGAITAAGARVVELLTAGRDADAAVST